MPSNPTSLAVALTASMLLVAVGCATRPAWPEAALRSVDASRPAAANLRSLAAREASRPAELRPNAAVPPSLPPDAVSPRPAEDARAWATLSEAIERVASERPLQLSPLPPSRELTPEERDEATRRFIRGREAMLDGQHLVAVHSLEEAARLDPHDPEVLRNLARGYRALGNPGSALDRYRTLLQAAPEDGEARFFLALQAIRDGLFGEAVSLLGPARAAAEGLEFDPGANLVADHALAIALRRLGYDRAAIEAAERSTAFPERFDEATTLRAELISLVRQRADIREGIGDALLRLGRPLEALAAYDAAEAARAEDRVGADATAAPADPRRLARRMHANLRVNRPFTAQAALYDAIERELGAEKPSPGLRRELARLAGFARRQAEPIDLLREAVAPLNPAERGPAGVRLAAALAPRGEAVEVLRSGLEAHGPDEDLWRDLLAARAEVSPVAAAREAMAIASRHPDRVEAVAASLLRATGAPPEALTAVREAPASAERALLEAYLRRHVGDAAGASEVLRAEATIDPADPRLVSAWIEAAALVGEPTLLEEAIAAGEILSPEPTVWLARARARRATGEIEASIHAARAAASLAPEWVPAWTAWARSLLMTDRPAEAARIAQRAVALSTAGVPSDPATPEEIDAAYETLLTVIERSGGAAPGDGAATDGGGGGGASDRVAAAAEVVRLLAREQPESRLLARLRADELARGGRAMEAVEILLPLHLDDPLDEETLTRLVRAWDEAGRGDGAWAWLNERRAQRPRDPVLLRGWTRAALRAGGERLAETEATLRRLVEEDGDFPAAAQMLETVLIARGEREAAYAMIRRRLDARPEGVRRTLDLAMLAAQYERWDEAEARLRELVESDDPVPNPMLIQAIATSGHLPSERPGTRPLRADLVDRYLARNESAPAEVFTVGLATIAATEGTGEAFDAMARRALAGIGPTAEPLPRVAAFRDVAQTLIFAGHPEAAARLLEVFHRESPPDSANARRVLAAVLQAAWIAAGDAEAAIDLTRELAAEGTLATAGASADPNAVLAEAYYNLSTLAALADRPEATTRLLRAALEVVPTHPMAANNLAYQRLEEGRAGEETDRLVEHALEGRGTDPSVLDTVGWHRYKIGRFVDDDEGDGARTFLERAASTVEEPDRPTAAEIHDHLGDTLARVGETAGAIRAWRAAERALSNAPARAKLIQDLGRYQNLGWGVVIANPEVVWEREYAPRLEAVREKIRRAEAGEAPEVAPTFREMNTTTTNAAGD